MKILNILIVLLLLLSGCAGDIALQREKIVQGSKAAVIGESSNVELRFLSQLVPHEVLIFLDSLRADELTKEIANCDLPEIAAREFSDRLKGSSLGIVIVPLEVESSSGGTSKTVEQTGEGSGNDQDRKDYMKIAEELNLRYLFKITITPQLELEWLPKQVVDLSLFGKVYPVISAKAEMIDLKTKKVLWRRSKQVVNDKILHSLDEYQANHAKLAKEAWKTTIPLLVDNLMGEMASRQTFASTTTEPEESIDAKSKSEANSPASSEPNEKEAVKNAASGQ